MEPVEKPEKLGFSQEGIHALEQGIERYVTSGRAAGLVTLLARHGEAASFKSYGYRDLSAKEPMTKDTIFQLHSMTKPVVGAAMMMLYEEGAWKLDDPITKFIPEFENLKVLTGVDADGEMIVEDVKRPPNMRELMNHTAGFGYGLIDTNPVDKAIQDRVLREVTSSQELVERIEDIPLLYQPGEGWAYSLVFELQGHVIEKISGQSLGAFLKERMFDPLGMMDTGFQIPEEDIGRQSKMYRWDAENGRLVHIGPDSPWFPFVPDPTRTPSFESGGGGLVSTASDFARFAQMVVNRGELDGVRILKPETVDLMLSDSMPEGVYMSPPGSGGAWEGMSFGLGWGLVAEPETVGALVGEGSALWGGAASTWFWVDPKNDLIFIGLVHCFWAGCDIAGGAYGKEQRFFHRSANLVNDALAAADE
ncbi:MAG: serine hydrolase domain-containing protein [Pseudomonadota bacterium]